MTTLFPKAASFFKNNTLLPLDEGGYLLLGREQAPKVNVKLAQAVLDILEAGLTDGLGEITQPGGMCVEAAVSAAMGMDTRDGPICVSPNLRALKIAINDQGNFNSKTDRAISLRRIAIAQLGTQVLIDKITTKGRGKAKKKIIKSVPAKTQPFDWERFDTLLKIEVQKLNMILINRELAQRLKYLKGKDKALWEMVCPILALGESTALRQGIFEHLGLGDPDIRFNFEYSGSEDFVSFMNNFSIAATIENLYKTTEKARDAVIECAVQVLIKMKTPGSKFLYLTEKKPKKTKTK